MIKKMLYATPNQFLLVNMLLLGTVSDLKHRKLTTVYGEESFVRSEESTLQDDFHRPLQVSVAYEHKKCQKSDCTDT